MRLSGKIMTPLFFLYSCGRGVTIGIGSQIETDFALWFTRFLIFRFLWDFCNFFFDVDPESEISKNVREVKYVIYALWAGCLLCVDQPIWMPSVMILGFTAYFIVAELIPSLKPGNSLNRGIAFTWMITDLLIIKGM